jgi:hypothetical protein
MKWNAILATLQELDDSFRKEGSSAWYRGHFCADWRLESLLHRNLARHLASINSAWSEEERVGLLRETYKTFYNDFKADAWPLLDPRERSDWGVVFAMQHYGQPTRLLDWTESIACATYFALTPDCLRCAQPGDAAIWVLDPTRLNGKSGFPHRIAIDEDTDKEKIPTWKWHPRYEATEDLLPSIAVSPIFTNPRMTAQRSAFTLSGDSSLSLDLEFPALVNEDRLVKLVLDTEAQTEARRFLGAAGTDAFTIYPDLHGLAMRHRIQNEEILKMYEKWYQKKAKES